MMKINQMNVQANTVSMDAQTKQVDPNQRPAQPRPVERVSHENTRTRRTNRSDVNEVMNEDMLQKSVDQANKSLEIYNRRIDRAVHEVTKTVMYTVKDTITDEIIQEFPPKKIQDMIAKMWELAGLFVDEKA